jgi:hypothetical protein
MDILGGAFKEQELLSLGYAVQQTLKLRRPPFSTPVLVGAAAPVARGTTLNITAGQTATDPPIRASLMLTFDQTTSRLHYALTADRPDLARLAAVWIHAGTKEKPGAARHRLFAAGRETSGTLTLSANDREALLGERLVVRVFIAGRAGSAADLPISLQKEL